MCPFTALELGSYSSDVLSIPNSKSPLVDADTSRHTAWPTAPVFCPQIIRSSVLAPAPASVTVTPSASWVQRLPGLILYQTQIFPFVRWNLMYTGWAVQSIDTEARIVAPSFTWMPSLPMSIVGA